MLRHVSRASMSRLGFLFSQNCRTPTQVNAQPLLREVQAAEEGLEAGVGAEPGGVWALAQGVCVPGAHVYAVPFRVAAALVAACGMSVGFLPWASSHKGALDRIVLPPC